MFRTWYCFVVKKYTFSNSRVFSPDIRDNIVKVVIVKVLIVKVLIIKVVLHSDV